MADLPSIDGHAQGCFAGLFSRVKSRKVDASTQLKAANAGHSEHGVSGQSSSNEKASQSATSLLVVLILQMAPRMLNALIRSVTFRMALRTSGGLRANLCRHILQRLQRLYLKAILLV